MFAARVVEAVDVFEEGYFDLTAGLPLATPDQFGFERLEEAFDSGIVVTVAFPTHRHLEPVLAQQLLIVVSAVLRPRCPATVCLQTVRGAIRVMNAPLWWPSDRDGHVQRPQGQILLHAVADGPTDDAPREKVNDHGKINPSLLRPDIGDVARLLPGNGLPANHERALLVRRARREVLLQEIRRDVEGVVAVGGDLELPCPHNLDAVLAHQPPHTALANLQTHLIQLLRHARSTVAAQAQAMLVADMGQEHHVTSLAL